MYSPLLTTEEAGNLKACRSLSVSLPPCLLSLVRQVLESIQDAESDYSKGPMRPLTWVSGISFLWEHTILGD